IGAKQKAVTHGILLENNAGEGHYATADRIYHSASKRAGRNRKSHVEAVGTLIRNSTGASDGDGIREAEGQIAAREREICVREFEHGLSDRRWDAVGRTNHLRLIGEAG